MEVLFIKNMYIIHFVIKFLGFTCICIGKKKHFTIPSSNFKH
jgi:hypothetical protein